MKKNFKEILTQITAFAFDVDGVFTDCTITIDAQGNMLRHFNVKDGLAVVRAIEKGYKIAIISGGKGKQLEDRMTMLGIRHIYLSRMSKTDSLVDFAQQEGLNIAQEILYMGDDYPDLAPMQMCCLGVAPSDATHSVRATADYTSSFAGGHGCVRDIIEQVLRARGDWFEHDNALESID